MTPRQQAAKTRRELERDYRQKQRARVKELRSHLKHAKGWRRSRLKKVRAICKHAKAMAREAARVIRAEHAAQVKRAIEAKRHEALELCHSKRKKAIAAAVHGVDRARIRLTSELTHQKTERIWDRSRDMKRGSSRRAELVAESDSQVEHNIPHELIPVWREVKAKIQATPRRSRTEAFAEWAAEHQSRVREIIDRDLEASIVELIKHESEQRRELGRSHKHLRAMPEAELRAKHKHLAVQIQPVTF